MSSQRLLVNLKIRSLTIRTPGADPVKVDNGSVRFTKVIEVTSIPKVGSVLTLTAGPDQLPFECTVTRAEWDARHKPEVEERNRLDAEVTRLEKHIDLLKKEGLNDRDIRRELQSSPCLFEVLK